MEKNSWPLLILSISYELFLSYRLSEVTQRGLGAHPSYIVVGAQVWVSLAEEGAPGEHGKDREWSRRADGR